MKHWKRAGEDGKASCALNPAGQVMYRLLGWLKLKKAPIRTTDNDELAKTMQSFHFIEREDEAGERKRDQRRIVGRKSVRTNSGCCRKLQ